MISPSQVFKNIYPEGPERPRSVVWAVDKDLPYLQGHFPQNPILPAIAIIDASTVVLQRLLDLPDLALKQVVNAKFLSPIVPGVQVRINCKPIKHNEWQVDWKEESTERMLATLDLQI